MPKDDLTKMLIRQAIDSLNAVSKTVEQLKAEMLKLSAQLPEYPVVMEMRGVGDWFAAHGGDWGCDPVCP